MKTKYFIGILIVIIVCTGTWFIVRKPSQTIEVVPSTPEYDLYNYGSADDTRIIDFGMQPNDLSPAVISESLFHDQVLKQQLSAEGWKLREHRYNNGNDMIPYLDGRLDVVLFGNQPSVTAMVQRNVGIFAICAVGHNTIIATGILTPEDFKGLRIGYPFNTNAQFALERALITAKLSMDDVISINMQPGDLESALRKHTVDAVISWEPITAAILENVINSVATFNTDSYTFVGFDLDFAKKHPTIQMAILAAIVRAVRWANKDDRNLVTSLHWFRQGSIAFSGESAVEPNAKWVALLKTQGIKSPSFPMLPRDIVDEQGLFRQQFEFLKKIGAIPSNSEWKVVRERVASKFLPEIIDKGESWQIETFDYSTEKLFQDKQ